MKMNKRNKRKIIFKFISIFLSISMGLPNGAIHNYVHALDRSALKDQMVAQNSKDVRDTRDTVDTRDTKSTRETRDTGDTGDIADTGDTADTKVTPERLRTSFQNKLLLHYQLSSPLWGEFFQELTQSHMQINLDPQDPIADEDPFFLKGQQWKNENENSIGEGFNFRRYSEGLEKGLEIRYSSSSGISTKFPLKSLKIFTPFIPIIETEDYILMTFPEDSLLFERKFEKNSKDSLDSSPGEGLFFISKEEFLQMEPLGFPLQIYFFPLPGTGWTGFLHALELPDFKKIVIEPRDKYQYRNSIPIDISDLTEVMKVQKLTRMLAIVDRMMVHPTNEEYRSEELLYPLPRSTAGFGMIGMKSPSKINSDDHSWGAAEHRAESKWAAMQFLNIKMRNAKGILQKTFSTLMEMFSVPKAQAVELQFSPEVLNQLMIYGKLLGGILATSVVLKYTLLRDRLKEIHQYEKEARANARQHWEERNPPDLEKALKKLKDPGATQQFFRDSFSIFAHGTTVLAQLAPVGLGTSVELFFDKTLPEYAASENKILRKILYKTVLWGKESASRVPVNWKTFLLGAVVLGLAVDTPFVAMQDLIFYPWLATVLYQSFPEGFAQKLYQAFVVDFESNKSTLIQGIFRTGSAWLMQGASHFSMDSKAQILSRVQNDVDAQLIREGLNPTDPSAYEIRKKRINEMVDQLSRQRGLPGSESFLFDLNTVISSFYSAFGYKVNRDSIQNIDLSKHSFVLEERPALAKNALRRAIYYARQRISEDSSTENREVLQLLEKTYKDMNLLQWDLVLTPIEKIKTFRRVRTTLTLLSYNGNLEEVIKYWANDYLPTITKFAGLLFNKALFTLLYSNGDETMVPPEAIVKEFGTLAESEVQRRVMEEAQLDSKKYSEWVNSHSLEHELELEQEIRHLQREKEKQKKISSFKPEKEDFLERFQKRRALRRTMQDFVTDLDSSSNNQKWRDLYTLHLAQEVGLYINAHTRDSLLAESDAIAMQSTENQINEVLGLKEYLDKLSIFQRLQFETNLYAVHFLNAYRDLTTRDTDKGDVDYKDWKKRMLMPDQPGVFQRFRQLRWVANSSLLTRVVRSAEILFDDEEIRPGLKPWIKRNIPLASDLMSAGNYMAKNYAIQTTSRYLVFSEIFEVKWEWYKHALFAVISPWLIYLPSMVLNRAFRQQGLKAMDTVRSKLFYGLLYTNATMGATVPFILYADDFKRLINDNIIPNLASAYSSVPEEFWMGLGISAGLSLIPQIREWVRNRSSGFKGQQEKAILSISSATNNRGGNLHVNTGLMPLRCTSFF